MVSDAPRSTCNHCGSLAALDHRVPVLPSTAFAATVPPFSVDDAVAVLPCDNNEPAACATLGTANTPTIAATNTTTGTRTIPRTRFECSSELMEPLPI